MRLVKFEYQGRSGQGVVLDEEIVPLGAWSDAPASQAPFPLPSLGPEELERLTGKVSDRIPLASVQLSAPVAPTSKIILLGFNYKAHIEETTGVENEFPPLFARWSDSLVGHEGRLVRPLASETYDFEGEFALVIGKGGRRIPRDSALDHVLGYTCFFDGSVRSYQKHSVTAGKNFPDSGAMGPWIVTGAENDADPSAFSLETRVNGNTVQSATGDLLIFDIPRIISYVSEFTCLSPGDVIATGTPGGVGARRNPPLWLKPGDTVEVEISGIGVLRNTVSAEKA